MTKRIHVEKGGVVDIAVSGFSMKNGFDWNIGEIEVGMGGVGGKRY